MSKTTSVVATAADAAGGKTTPKAGKAPAVNGSPAPAATAAEPVNGEVAPPASNRVTIRSDRQPANVSMAQLALQMSKRSGERRGASSTAPAVTSRSAEQASAVAETAMADRDAETPAEEAAETEQVEQADAGVNESTEVLPHGALGEEGAEGAAPEGAELDREPGAEAEAEVLPKNVKDLQARVNKLTARAKQAEAKLASLQQNGAAREGTRATATGAAHPELQGIEGQLAVFREALEFAEANPDGGEYTDPATGKKTFYDAARVRTIRRNAEEGRQLALSDKAALQRQIQTEFAQARQADQAQAVKDYPWLAKEPEALTETEAQMVSEFQQILQMQPSLKQAPDYVSWIADAVAGRQARLARAGIRGPARPIVPNPNDRKPPSGSRTPPAVVTRAAAAAPKVNPAQAAVKAAEEKFRKTGHARDYEKLLSAQAAARRTAA